MSDGLVELKIQARDGTVASIRVQKLLAVDGEAYTAAPADLRDALLYLDGRLTAIESLLAGSLQPHSPTSE